MSPLVAPLLRIGGAFGDSPNLCASYFRQRETVDALTGLKNIQENVSESF